MVSNKIETETEKQLEAFYKHKDYLVESKIVIPVYDHSNNETIRYRSKITKEVEDFYGVRKKFRLFKKQSNKEESLTVNDFVKTQDRLWCVGTPSKLLEIVRDISLDESIDLDLDQSLECSKVRYRFILSPPPFLKYMFYTSLTTGLSCIVGSIMTSDPRFLSGFSASAPFLIVSSSVLFATYAYDKNKFPGSNYFFNLYKRSREVDSFIESLI